MPAVKIDPKAEKAKKPEKPDIEASLAALATDLDAEIEGGIKEPLRSRYAALLGVIKQVHNNAETARRLIRPEEVK